MTSKNLTYTEVLLTAILITMLISIAMGIYAVLYKNETTQQSQAIPILYVYKFTNDEGLYWYVDAISCLEYPSLDRSGEKINVRCTVPNPTYMVATDLIFDNVTTLELISSVYNQPSLERR